MEENIRMKKFNLTSNNFAFSEEIKIEALRKSNLIEIPIKYCKRIGKSKLISIYDGIKNFVFLFTKRIKG